MPSPPIDLATIKDDLGMPAGDTTNDAWLQRRIDGVWARFQQYTARPLLPSSSWTDDWGKLVTNHPAATEPPLWRAAPSGTVYLRVFPVQTIVSLSLNDAVVDPTRLIVEPATGKLIGLDSVTDLRRSLIGGRALIQYEAGFEALPADLYEALLGVLATLWGARQTQASGAAGGAPKRIAAIDVGEIEFNTSANVFLDATLKGVRTTDPLLGPYGMLLDTYVDWRSIVGGPLPETLALGPAPGASARAEPIAELLP